MKLIIFIVICRKDVTQMTRKFVKKITMRQAQRKGRLDGRDWILNLLPPLLPLVSAKTPIPTNDSKESEYEQTLASYCAANIINKQDDWQEANKKLSEQCQIYSEKVKLAEKNLSDYDADLVTKSEEKHKAALHDLDQISPPAVEWKLMIYLLYVIILVSECLFNGLCFQVMGQNILETFLMAAGFVLAVTYLSHSMGKMLRSHERSRVDNKLLFAKSALLIWGIIEIATIREQYLEASDVINLLGLSMDSRQFTVMFISINMILAMTILDLAFQSSREYPKKYLLAMQAAKSAKSNFDTEYAKYRNLQDEYSLTSIELNKACIARNNDFQKYLLSIQEERLGWISLIRIYRAANIEARSKNRSGTPMHPPAFETDPENLVKAPQTNHLEEFGPCDENCPQKKGSDFCEEAMHCDFTRLDQPVVNQWVHKDKSGARN